jgi:hypothetical protein
VSIEDQHVAMPKLKGAPAYARPQPHTSETPRPFDPDELPIEAWMTEDDRAAVASPDGEADDQDAGDDSNGHRPRLLPRPFSIKGLTGRIRKSA